MGSEPSERPNLSPTWLGWLRLLRPPNLFTVPGDPLAGFFLASASAAASGFAPVILCMAASLLIYMAGLLANDYFDLAEDKIERPDRPLPSGQVVPLAAAVALAALGVVVAGLASRHAALIAGALVLMVVFYDAFGKRWPVWGVLNMGLCRGLSLLLGAAAAGGVGLAVPAVLLSAIGLTAYITAVSHIAKWEAVPTRFAYCRWAPMAVLVVWLAGLYGFAAPLDGRAILLSGALAAAALLWTALCGWRLAGEVPPGRISETVGALLRGLLLIQAALCAWVFWQGAVAAAALLIVWPASRRLTRWFYAS